MNRRRYQHAGIRSVVVTLRLIAVVNIPGSSSARKGCASMIHFDFPLGHVCNDRNTILRQITDQRTAPHCSN